LIFADRSMTLLLLPLIVIWQVLTISLFACYYLCVHAISAFYFVYQVTANVPMCRRLCLNSPRHLCARQQILVLNSTRNHAMRPERYVLFSDL